MTNNSLSLYFLENHSQDAARLLEKYDPFDLVEYLEQCSPESIANIFRHINPSIAASCLINFDLNKSTLILEQFSIERAALLLRRIPFTDRIRLIRNMSPVASNMIRLVLRYPQGTVGRVMNPNVFAVSKERSVSDIISSIQASYDQVRSKVYIIDNKHQLVGMVFIRDLLISDANQNVEKIMREPESTISARASLTSIMNHPQWNDRDNLPVVDKTGKFIGILKRGVMLDTLKREQYDAQQGEGIVDTAMSLAELFWETCANVIVPQNEKNDEGKKNE